MDRSQTQGFNAEGTGFFWKMPNRTFIFRVETTVPGFKVTIRSFQFTTPPRMTFQFLIRKFLNKLILQRNSEQLRVTSFHIKK